MKKTSDYNISRAINGDRPKPKQEIDSEPKKSERDISKAMNRKKKVMNQKNLGDESKKYRL